MHTTTKTAKRTRNRNNVLLAIALLLAITLSIAIPSLHAAAIGTAGASVNQVYDNSAVIIRIAQSKPLPSAAPTGATATASSTTNGGLLIDKAGTYRLSGTIGAQITVEADGDDDVVLILDGLTALSSAGPALNIVSAKNVTIYLQPGTTNSLTDTTASDAALLSKADLTIYGTGTLLVNGRSSHGLVSKDDLVIAGGTIKVQAVADGIKGKDSITVSGAAVEIIAGGDGMQAYNEEDPARGYINIISGTIQITSTLDGIQGHTLVRILGGNITIKSGGGSASRASSESTKGIKAEKAILIEGGAITIDSRDDALHSNHTITIKAGELNLSSGDDGIHADNTLTLTGGVINIIKSYEAVEGTNILISGGTITMNSSDDGINTVNKTTASSTGFALAGRPGAGGGFQQSDGSTFLMTGGIVYMNASGDGLDINGDGVMTGGTMIISGPTGNQNGAVDYNGSLKISGGTLVAAGSSGMAQAPGTGSTQSSLMLNLSSQNAGSVVAVKDSSGKVIMAYAPAKSFTNLVFSSPELIAGATYTVVTGGTTIGTSKLGLLAAGSYSLGTQTSTGTAALVVSATGGFGQQQPGQGPMPTGGARKTW